MTARVDGTHPLAESLVACHLPCGAGLCNVGGGDLIPTTGSVAHGATAFGYGVQSTAANGGAKLTVGTAHPLSIQWPLSIMWVGSFTATPNASASIYGVSANDADTNPWLAYSLGLSSGGFQLQVNAANINISTTPTAVPSVGPTHVVIGALSSTVQSCSLDGVVTSQSGVSGAIVYSATSVMALNYYFTSRAASTVTNMGCIWNRELSAVDQAMLLADPFCFLRW